eukprot:235486-Alexandrium_andersonii.AAC.1
MRPRNALRRSSTVTPKYSLSLTTCSRLARSSSFCQASCSGGRDFPRTFGSPGGGKRNVLLGRGRHGRRFLAFRLRRSLKSSSRPT